MSAKRSSEISAWIKARLKSTGAKGLVLGLSGGIDSAVAALLAKQAAGAANTLALILPIHSPDEELGDARLLAKKFGLRMKSIDLSPVYDSLIKLLPQASRLAKANLKPRLRMMVIYYFANKLGYLVCGTSNKSERLIGYFTKYGDAGVDIMPLGGMFKRQVISLARQLGVPEPIITKQPTAGLWPGQTDEEEIGLSYDQLDDILCRCQMDRKQVVPAGKVSRVMRMIRSTEHKRKMPDICPV